LIDPGSYNIIEFCSFYENRDTGLQLANGAAYNKIINCDSYNNTDPGHGNADGFAPKLTVGTGNYFFGCRAWQNSDDGFDGYLRDVNNVETILEHCWIFMNGYLANGSPSSGNGNGFKMGGSENRDLSHNITLKNCLAFDNRVKGFDQNNNRGSMTIYHGSSYRNGTNYSLNQTLDSGKSLSVINSLAMGTVGPIGSFAVQQTNSWMLPFTVTSSDFVSLDTTGVRGPRKPDGSLPDVPFLRLAAGSGLIDAGTNVGTPYNGVAPDIGAFESGGPVVSAGDDDASPGSFSVFQNYPNPSNPETTIEFDLAVRGEVTIRVYDLSGRLVKEVLRRELAAGRHRARWDGSDAMGRRAASGTYLAVVQHGKQKKTLKLQLLK
ncbi:MAG: FlgD immunoglobulin-like domain containing protein, partial [Bacteroidota bacterium]